MTAREVPLSDCADWYSGGTPKTSVDEYWDGDIPWITSGSLTRFRLRDSERKLTRLGVENGSRLVPPGAVLFVVRGMSLMSEFRIGIAQRELAFGQDCKALIAKEGILPDYLAYSIAGRSREVLGMVDQAAHGTGRLPTDLIGSLPIRVAPEREQQAIVKVLSAFDDLIENNRQRIQTLDEMARLIYREWFVHFRFPGHEDVELVDSDLGAIPDGWTVAITADLISAGVLEIGDGYRAKNSELSGHAYAFVRVKNVGEGHLHLADVDYLPEPYGAAVGGKRGRPGDCVISMKGTVGRMAFVGERTPPLIYSPQVSYWRPLQPDRLSPVYLRLWMQSPVFVEQCARVKGATDMADYVNLRDQRTMRLVLPSHSVHAAFVAAVSPLLALADNLRSQVEVLESARDLLLPRLISGELDVSGLELDLAPVA